MNGRTFFRLPTGYPLFIEDKVNDPMIKEMQK